MFCENKNSYLQMVVAVNPRIINKAVTRAMWKRKFHLRDDLPPAQRVESMQPSLFAPHVDITRARMGFGRRGLRILNRELHSEDNLVQVQALHSILDQVQISENAMFLINLQLVYRLINLMTAMDPVIREKVCMTLTHLSTYYQGRNRIITRPIILDHLLFLIMRDRKEIRYAAAYTLKTLSSYLCCCEFIMKHKSIVEDLLKMIKKDHVGIVLLYLRTLQNLTAWDAERALKANAFQIMLKLFEHQDTRIVSASMDVMTQLCKHDVGKKLADNNDLNFFLRQFINSNSIEVLISCVALMCHTTITTRSKWRAKEAVIELTKRLSKLCHTPNNPVLQLHCIQTLLNLCDCPDIRSHLKMHWEFIIQDIDIRTHEEWNGTSETTSFGLETGHNYRTMCIERLDEIRHAETIKNDGLKDGYEAVNVHSYLRRIHEKKDQLVKSINFKCYKTADDVYTYD